MLHANAGELVRFLFRHGTDRERERGTTGEEAKLMEFPANTALLVESHLSDVDPDTATATDADSDDDPEEWSEEDLDQIMGLDSNIEQEDEVLQNVTVDVVADESERNERIAEYDGAAPLPDIHERIRETAIDCKVYSAFLDIFSDERRRPVDEPGTLDLRQATRYVCGDTTTDPYEEWTEVTGGNVAVGVSLDQSGSMGQYEVESKSAVGAFLDAVQKFGGEVVANAWQGGSRSADSVVLTRPREKFDWEHLLAVRPRSSDPISAGLLHCASLLDRVAADEKLLLVVHDGHPTVLSRTDLDKTDACREAAETVDELRDEGFTVIGVGFGGVSERNLARMFGEDGYVHTELERLADALVESYEKLEDDHGGGA
ncbi:vWA domain-containing protein [Halorussus pelagicus]|uniref:hypothetical protein n=1 Tax=Halorussus pelagicus TaxID=2505977 RepID=UPI000FFC3B35|nr:hypothetical protein [Halorussus pelagicus]